MPNENSLKNLTRGGRKPGQKNNKTILQEALIQDAQETMVKHFPKIVETACQLALQGDTKAMKMIFDRLVPAKKAMEYTQSTGQAGVTIIVQGMAQVENGHPVIEHESDENVPALDVIDANPITSEVTVTTNEVITNET